MRTNKFYLDARGAKSLAKEILASHFKLEGAEAEKYLNEHFKDTFDYFDVNDTGLIDAIGCFAFFRRLTGPLGDLHLE